MRRSMRWTVAVLVVWLVALAGCGGSSDDSGDDGDDATDEEAASSGNAFVDLMSVIPDTADNRAQVFLADWSAAAAFADVDAPDDAEDVIDYILEIDRETERSFYPGVDWLQNADQSEEFEEQLGFHLGQIDASAVAGLPPAVSYAYQGRFDVDAITDAIEEDPEFSEFLEVVEHNGTEYFSWDDEPEPGLGAPGPRDQLGRGGNIYVTENELWWAFSSDTIEGMIDAREGDEDSLADDDALVAAAEQLGELGVYSAMIIETDGADYGTQFGGSVDDRPEGPVLEPYEVLATGAFADDGDLFGTIILVNEDEDTAEANAELLTEVVDAGESAQTGEPWSERLEIVEIESDGLLTVATLEVENGPQLLVDVVFRLDSLYASE